MTETNDSYDPFRNSESVTLREFLDEVFDDLIYELAIEGDPYSGENALTVNSRIFADEDRPLHVAARRGNARCVQLLLEAGADPNAKGDLSVSPLHWAVCSGNLEIAKLLLDAGARIDVLNEFDRSNLDTCAPSGLHPNAALFRLLQSYWP